MKPIYWIGAAVAVVIVALMESYRLRQANLVLALEESVGLVPPVVHSVGGRLLRDTRRPNWLPPSSPELIDDDESIPSDAFAVMTSVGSRANSRLLLDPTLEASMYTAPIPQVVEVFANLGRESLVGAPTLAPGF